MATPTLTPTLIQTPTSTPTLIATPTLTPTLCNSGTEFRELGRAGIERNYTELLGIPGVPSNSQQFRTVLIPEFRPIPELQLVSLSYLLLSLK